MILYFIPDLKENLIRYFETQLTPSLKGKRGNNYKWV